MRGRKGRNTYSFLELNPVSTALNLASTEVPATRYGLDGPEFESRYGRDFPRPSIPVLEPTQLPNGYRVIPGDKEAGAWR
jgi:hypothetical protein